MEQLERGHAAHYAHKVGQYDVEWFVRDINCLARKQSCCFHCCKCYPV